MHGWRRDDDRGQARLRSSKIRRSRVTMDDAFFFNPVTDADDAWHSQHLLAPIPLKRADMGLGPLGPWPKIPSYSIFDFQLEVSPDIRPNSLRSPPAQAQRAQAPPSRPPQHRGTDSRPCATIPSAFFHLGAFPPRDRHHRCAAPAYTELITYLGLKKIEFLITLTLR